MRHTALLNVKSGSVKRKRLDNLPKWLTIVNKRVSSWSLHAFVHAIAGASSKGIIKHT